MSVQEEERAAVEYLSSSFQAEGYDVIFSTSNFRLGGYIPDLVAKKNDEIVFVEVKHRKTPTIEKRMEELRKEIESKPHQKFQVYYLADLPLPKGPKIQANNEIDKLVSAISTALESKAFVPAFLASWAAFEAAGRRVFKNRLARPQSPARLISVLAEEGVLFGAKVEVLRGLAAKRNSLIHGGLDTEVSLHDIQTMIEAVKEVQRYSLPPERGSQPA
ncbi:hypothetical protein KBY25_14025 [Ruegeria pomeroyi]|nr:hypothetical protein [Ruegeria pomeroyi]